MPDSLADLGVRLTPDGGVLRVWSASATAMDLCIFDDKDASWVATTLPLAKTEESKARLTAIIQHDVRRLNRLITDISDAARLDAELARQDALPMDLAQLARTVVGIARETRKPDEPKLELVIAPADKAA